jgi:hypothetical protein
MMQVAVQLAHMPLNLVCLSNGLVAFVRTQAFSTIWESFEGYDVCIDENGISFQGERLVEPLDIPYNVMVSITDNPVLKEWLVSMKLTSPI